MDFTLFFEKYEALAKTADAAFETIRKDHGDCVTCRTGCADCCHALFDLTLVEAMYINDRFRRRYTGDEREGLLEKAAVVDRALAKIKRKVFKRAQGGEDHAVLLEEMAAVRMRCPLLDDDDQCVLYDFRPITCRLYGVPTSINGQAHTCGLTGFDQGQAYPTVKLEAIQGRLFALSGELVRAIGSKYSQMDSLLVPLSMALVTEYTDDYLGISVIQSVPVEPEGETHG